MAQLGVPEAVLQTPMVTLGDLAVEQEGEPVAMGELVGLGLAVHLGKRVGHALKAELLELVEGRVMEHDGSSMEVFRAADVGMIDRRAVRGPLRRPAIEVVPEDGGDRGVGSGADLEGPLTGGLEPFVAMAPGQAQNADGRAEPLFGMGARAHDDVDQGLGIGTDGGGVMADPLRRPGGEPSMGARHVLGQPAIGLPSRVVHVVSDWS